jgi:cytidylate kinase
VRHEVRRARGDQVSRVLTVSATYGAGGSVVAPGLAERLGLHFYDRLTHGPDTRTPERIAERLTEEERTQVPPGRVVASLSHLGSALGMPLGDAADLDPNAELRRQVAESVARIAAGGGGVVLGRGAAVLLASHPTTFHVRLDGPVDRRVAQGMRLEDVSEQIARSHQADTDKAWSRFVQRLFERDPADPRLYHLIVDSTAIPLPDVIELVAIAAGGFWAAER